MLLAERGLEGFSHRHFGAGRPRRTGRGPKPERGCNRNGYNPIKGSTIFFYKKDVSVQNLPLCRRFLNVIAKEQSD
jgi:hypothetical protein